VSTLCSQCTHEKGKPQTNNKETGAEGEGKRGVEKLRKIKFKSSHGKQKVRFEISWSKLRAVGVLGGRAARKRPKMLQNLIQISKS
jgi:hypothetical protein